MKALSKAIRILQDIGEKKSKKNDDFLICMDEYNFCEHTACVNCPFHDKDTLEEVLAELKTLELITNESR